MRDANRLLTLLLRLSGCVLISAFGAVVLPTDWMQAAHEWLGLGEFPRVPLVQYLTRSIALLYGFHGVLMLLVSANVQRYRPIIRFVAVMNVIFGATMIAIDLAAAMPLAWTLIEGPPILAFGVVILALLRRGDAAA